MHSLWGSLPSNRRLKRKIDLKSTDVVNFYICLVFYRTYTTSPPPLPTNLCHFFRLTWTTREPCPPAPVWSGCPAAHIHQSRPGSAPRHQPRACPRRPLPYHRTGELRTSPGRRLSAETWIQGPEGTKFAFSVYFMR